MRTFLPVMFAVFILAAVSSALAQSITDVPRGHGHMADGRSQSVERHHPETGEAPLSDQRQERSGRYRIEDGRMKIDFRCPEGAPDRDCADLLLQVLDRLQGGEFSGDSDFRAYEDRTSPRDR